MQATLAPPQAPKGHRRVKSLVREFDEKLPVTSDSPPVSPTQSLASPPPRPPSRPPPGSTHTRRAASVSYSPSTHPTGSPLLSPPLTYKSSAFPSSHSITNLSSGLLSPTGVPGGPGPTQRRVSAPYALSTPTAPMQRIPSPSPSPANAYRSVSAGAPPSVNNVRGGEDPAVTAASAAAERAEEDDVFLPLASDPPSPFTANLFNGTNPSSPAAQNPTHARKHSRIHERNLSAFFPRPGQAPGAGYGDMYDDPNGASPSTATASVRDMPSQVDEREAAAAASRAKAQGRRGHHHRHSLSHNFTSSPGGGGDESSYSDYSASPSSAAFSTPSFPVPSSLPQPSSHSRFSGLPSPLRLLAFIAVYLPFQTKAALGLATIQIALGATLWISGQSRESLAVTGLGYLVVFDGLAGVSRVLVEGAKGVENMWLMWAGGRVVDKGVRLPFGNQRLVTLSHFSQAIYLLFSAVYVCKESVEHVLLLHGGTEAEGAHGAGHGMGHGDSGGGGSSSGLDSGISLPVFFLALSALCSLISAIALSNHQGLSDAVGPSSFSRPRPRSSSPSLLDLVGNPYTLTVLTFSLGLASAHFVIPRAQLAPLDKVVALLESITMFYVAYPAAVATGQVLLQTSPSPSAAQMTTLTNGIRDIENHPLVLLVPPPHIWQLTPSPLSSSSSPSSSSSNRRPKDPNTATLIATITIQVSPDASDGDLLQVTKFARERCALEGELTVSVVRAKRGPGGAGVKFFGSPTVGAGEGKGHASHGSHGGGGHSHQH